MLYDLELDRQDAYVPPKTAPHPWKRFFARVTDNLLIGTALFAFEMLVMQMPLADVTDQNAMVDWLAGLIAFALRVPVFAFLLCTVGTTPGKWIFGLTVRQRGGGKLTFGQALNRELGVFIYGQGVNVPLVLLWRNWKSYKSCVDGDILPWDEEIDYSIKERSWDVYAVIAANIAITMLFMLITRAYMLPVNNHPGLTRAEVLENCRVYAHKRGLYEGLVLGEDGIWRDNPDDQCVIIEVGGLDDEVWCPAYEFTEENGIVTGVRLEVETEERPWMYITSDDPDTDMLIHAFFMPNLQAGYDGWYKGIKLGVERTRSSSCCFGTKDVGITNTVEYRGYEKVGDEFDPMLIPIEGEDTYFHWVFEMTAKP